MPRSHPSYPSCVSSVSDVWQIRASAAALSLSACLLFVLSSASPPYECIHSLRLSLDLPSATGSPSPQSHIILTCMLVIYLHLVFFTLSSSVMRTIISTMHLLFSSFTFQVYIHNSLSSLYFAALTQLMALGLPGAAPPLGQHLYMASLWQCERQLWAGSHFSPEEASKSLGSQL